MAGVEVAVVAGVVAWPPLGIVVGVVFGPHYVVLGSSFGASNL